MEIVPKEKGKFIVVKCKDCQNEQNVFNKPATTVVCLMCGSTIIKPVGGKGELVNGEIVSVLN